MTQPWRWRCGKCNVDVIPDRSTTIGWHYVCNDCKDEIIDFILGRYQDRLAEKIGNYLYQTLEIEFAEQHVRHAIGLEVEEI